jgi:type I restriction enzyme M protein
MAEIEKEGYNLNISRYISTATAEEEIDLAATRATLAQLDAKIRDANKRHNSYLSELGLQPLP